MNKRPYLSNLKPIIKFFQNCIKYKLIGLQYFFNTLSVTCLAGIVLVISWQVFVRANIQFYKFCDRHDFIRWVTNVIPDLFLDYPSWSSELSIYLFIYSVVFASGTIIIKQKHIKLELLRGYRYVYGYL